MQHSTLKKEKEKRSELAFLTRSLMNCLLLPLNRQTSTLQECCAMAAMQRKGGGRGDREGREGGRGEGEDREGGRGEGEGREGGEIGDTPGEW